MPKIQRNLILNCLRQIVRPLVRFCMRHSIKIQDLIECIKLEFIECAASELQAQREKITDSRLSVISGLHRRDILRLRKNPDLSDGSKDLISKVIGHWLGHKKFTTSRGQPRILSVGFDGCDFNQLVSAVSQDLKPATVLFELERVSSVEKTPGGVKLLTESYLPEGDAAASFKIASSDFNDLIETVEYNSFKNPEMFRHHLRTEYDRVREDALPEINAWLLREGHSFHHRAREFISQFDLDINPDLKSKERGKRVVYSSFAKIDGD